MNLKAKITFSDNTEFEAEMSFDELFEFLEKDTEPLWVNIRPWAQRAVSLEDWPYRRRLLMDVTRVKYVDEVAT